MFKQAYRFDDETIFYFDAYDNKYVAKGGSLSWRLNNPGLLRTYEPFVHKFNPIGAQFPFLIFSSPAVGAYALSEWLKSKFINARLIAIAKCYQPQASEDFLQKLCQLSDLSADTEIKVLSNDKLHRLCKAIQLLCKFSAKYEGEFKLLPKISARYYSKDGKVEYYLVGFETLLTKLEAISWIETHRLDAVLVHRSNGTIYLRSRPGHHFHRIRFSSEECGPEVEFQQVIREIGDKKEKQCIWGYINGVWNSEQDAINSTSFISRKAGNEQVFSLINDTKGLPRDLLECGRQKLNLSSPIVKYAAKFSEILIHLSDSDRYKPPVVVFAHSQGAIIADLALELLDQTNCKTIRLFTFGGGSFIAPGKAHEDSHNYISEADLIPRFACMKDAQLIMRRHDKQKMGFSEKQIIDLLVDEDIDYYLETTDEKAISIFRGDRRKHYEKEMGKNSQYLCFKSECRCFFKPLGAFF